MGNFYANITTRNISVDLIKKYLKSNNLSAYVIKVANDYCAIFEAVCDEQNGDHISSLLKEISGQFSCPAIAVLNHDDDILAYELWLNGEKVDEYDSCPGYFQADEDRMQPEGGNAKLLSELMGNGNNVNDIERLLRSNKGNEFSFAIDRHESIAKAVGIPLQTVGYGYTYISNGEMPKGVLPESIVKINTPENP